MPPPLQAHQSQTNPMSCAALLAPGMHFGAFLETIVRPDFLIHRQLRSVCRRRLSRRCCGDCHRAGRRFRSGARSGIRRRIVQLRQTPIFWRIGNPPNISVRIKRSPNQKILAVAPERQTVHYPRRHAASARQFAQQDRGFRLQRPRTPKPASLRAHNHRQTLVGKRSHPVKTGHADRNLHPQPRAPSSRILCKNFHRQCRPQSQKRPNAGKHYT
jgi:hypothetical protein